MLIRTPATIVRSPALTIPPLLEGDRHFNDIGDFVVATRADVTVTVATFPDVPVLGQSRWQPLPRRLRLCRQQRCAEKLAARDALRRSLNAQRQRIRRLDEAYRVAKKVRNAQSQRRLRDNAEYRTRELHEFEENTAYIFLHLIMMTRKTTTMTKKIVLSLLCMRGLPRLTETGVYPCKPRTQTARSFFPVHPRLPYNATGLSMVPLRSSPGYATASAKRNGPPWRPCGPHPH
ncbi:hypothetical protein MTO96_027453 [Rhipicephalus appendiculatus]